MYESIFQHHANYVHASLWLNAFSFTLTSIKKMNIKLIVLEQLATQQTMFCYIQDQQLKY